METNNKEPLAEVLAGSFPGCTVTESYGMEAVVIPVGNWKSSCKRLRDDFHFNMLVCLSAVDRKEEGIEVFAHLRAVSQQGDKNLIVKCTAAGELPEIESLCGIWCSAELYEDEIYDLFGVTFSGHPFLRRLFLDNNFKGHPLRKNYGEILEHKS